MSFIRKIKKQGKTYLAEVENKRVDGKVIQKHIRYIGKEIDGKTILSSSVSNIAVDCVKVYGPLIALNSLAKEIGLSETLGEFGDEILSMVYAHCIDYQSINKMGQWFERTDLNMILNLEMLTESRLLKALDSLENCDSFALQKNIFSNVKKKFKLGDNAILYDVTNTYLYGKKCPLAKPGKDKEGVKGRPLIQIGLGVTKSEGIPIFHKVFDGNIHDSKTLHDLITSLDELKIKDGLLVFDRGITSKQNQEDIKGMIKWKVVCGLPIKASLKNVLRPIIKTVDFLQYENRIRLNKSIFYVIIKPYTIGSVRGKIAICFNEQQRKDLRESRYDEIKEAQHLLSQSKQIKAGIKKFFNGIHINKEKLKEAEEFDGYSVIFTTDNLSKKEIVKIYFDKDLVEKAFQSLKGVIKIQPIRHWLYNRVIAHVFVCYLAYLLLSLLKVKLHKTGLSPVAALKELDSMYKVYMRDTKKEFKISRVVTLTKKQELILKAVNKKLLKLV